MGARGQRLIQRAEIPHPDSQRFVGRFARAGPDCADRSPS